jgi:hypothetical protein
MDKLQVKYIRQPSADVSLAVSVLMRRPTFVALLIIMLVVSARAQTTPKRNPLLIVFDDWWNVDFVKNGCQLSAPQRPCPSDRTPKEVVKEFENELEVAFASESACHGLSMVHFSPEMASTAVKNPTALATGAMAKTAEAKWSLMLDLDGHSHSQVGRGWTLVDSDRHSFEGRITTPERVVQKVCKIVRGVGGKSEN